MRAKARYGPIGKIHWWARQRLGAPSDRVSLLLYDFGSTPTGLFGPSFRAFWTGKNFLSGLFGLGKNSEQHLPGKSSRISHSGRISLGSIRQRHRNNCSPRHRTMEDTPCVTATLGLTPLSDSQSKLATPKTVQAQADIERSLEPGREWKPSKEDTNKKDPLLASALVSMTSY